MVDMQKWMDMAKANIHVRPNTTGRLAGKIAIVTGGATPGAGLKFTVGAATIDLGAFIGAIINFLIIALVVFLLVKAVNNAGKAAAKLRGKEEEEEAEEEPPTCPFCLEEVKEGATRCPHCSGVFDTPAQA